MHGAWLRAEIYGIGLKKRIKVVVSKPVKSEQGT